jgi:DNA (cytosine-5)-methyltransferase 1
MASTYQVVDLFAGPGGLAEGFSSLVDEEGARPFQVTLSVEKEASAHRTLQLRAFLRQFDEFPDEYYDALNAGQRLPEWSRTHEGEWETALEEALQLELGTPEAARVLDNRIVELVKLGVPTVVIGGPPCQAYSLVGRARNQGTEGYIAEDDKRHFLYREYIRILKGLRPVAFVMENVKGILSSSIDGRLIFEQVLADLRAADGSPNAYELFALALDDEGHTVLRRTSRQQDFVVRSEDFGVPQARHRVIVVGLRRDVAQSISSAMETTGTTVGEQATVRDVLSGLPGLRSGLSRGDDAAAWRDVVIDQIDTVIAALEQAPGTASDLVVAARRFRQTFVVVNDLPPRSSTSPTSISPECPSALAAWLTDPRLKVTLNHSSRGHMVEDLGRYFFSSVFTSVRGRAPKAGDFPTALAPDHANWDSGKFADRFRTQGWDQPSTTVTSHISKDGHYFIHPDPVQCRSLTVREAARLQTFPDNYLFLGNRTQQYVQVGNAVPPFLARQIAEVLHRALTARG